MGINVGELFVSLGFDVDDKKLKEFNDQFKSGVNDIQRYSDKVKAFTGGTLASATAMKNFTEQTGYSSRALQQWAVAARLTNPAITADQAANSYERLGKALIQIKQGQGPAGILAQLGMNFKPDADVNDVLQELADNRERIVKERGVGVYTDLLDQLGLGANWDKVLQLTANQRDKLTEGKILKDGEVEKLAKANALLNEISVELGRIQAITIADVFTGAIQFWDLITGKKSLKDIDKDYYAENPNAKPENTGFGPTVGSWLQGLSTKWNNGDIKPIPSPTSDKPQNYIDESMRFWVQKGMTKEQAAGPTAAVVHESGGDPRAVGDTDLARGPSRGLFQHEPRRIAKIKEDFGIDMATAGFHDQLEGAYQEMVKMVLFDKLLRTKGAYDSSALTTRLFERPANMESEVYKRGQTAEQIARSSSVTQTNNFVINSTANPKDIAAEVEQVLQRELSATGATLNLGPAY